MLTYPCYPLTKDRWHLALRLFWTTQDLQVAANEAATPAQQPQEAQQQPQQRLQQHLKGPRQVRLEAALSSAAPLCLSTHTGPV